MRGWPRQVLRLYLVVGADACGPRDLGDLVRAAVAGGVGCVQLREKRADTRTMLARARLLREVLAEAPRRVPLLINDRVDIALAGGADGVHLGATDLPATLARQLMPDGLIGLSLEAPADLAAAPLGAVDYVAASPVFATASKDDAAAPMGLDGLRALRAATALPLVAIAGIDAARAGAVFEAGADGIAVVSAICAAPDPRAAAAALAARLPRD